MQSREENLGSQTLKTEKLDWMLHALFVNKKPHGAGTAFSRFFFARASKRFQAPVRLRQKFRIPQN